MRPEPSALTCAPHSTNEQIDGIGVLAQVTRQRGADASHIAADQH
jgi:hypothetical protein